MKFESKLPNFRTVTLREGPLRANGWMPYYPPAAALSPIRRPVCLLHRSGQSQLTSNELSPCYGNPRAHYCVLIFPSSRREGGRRV
jgi:hypothetical protein